MSKTVLPMFVSLLFAGQAFATFELKDPAAEIYEETPEAIAEALGRRACSDFLLAGAKDPEEYKEDLVRVRDYVLGSGADARSIPAEADLRTFCIDHPKRSLGDAVDTLVGGSQ